MNFVSAARRALWKKPPTQGINVRSLIDNRLTILYDMFGMSGMFS